MRIFLVLSLLFAVVAASWAQPKMDSFDLHVASLRILEDRQVQAEIGVSATQRAMMDQFANKYNSDLRAYADQLKKQGKDPAKMTGPDDKMLGMLAKLKQNVMGVLSAGQLKRLREISLQAYALNGLMDSVVAKRVGISEAQLKKMRATFEQGSKTANDMIQKVVSGVNAEFKNAAPKTDADKKATLASYEQKTKAAMAKVEPDVQKVREATRQKILAMITAKQKAAFLALQGKPFKPKK
jgi:hypothetical protein